MDWVKKMWRIVFVLAAIAVAFVAIRYVIRFIIPLNLFSKDRFPIAQNGGNVIPPVREKTVSQKTEFYEINASYPEITLGTITTDGEAFVRAKVLDFIRENRLSEVTADNAADYGIRDGYKYTLDISYREARSAKYITYLYTVSYYTLGAHPFGVTTAYAYDRSGKRILLSEFFKPGALYLTRLSELSRRELGKRSDLYDYKDMIIDGTAPVAGNFIAFIPHDDTLEIIFQQYQVAPYVAGTPSIQIAWAELADILK